MIKEKRTPMDLMDDIYSLAYWMTGSEAKRDELVKSTYLHVDRNTPEREVFKTFRTCYFDSIDEAALLNEPKLSGKAKESKALSLRRRFADIKLSVLLSEIPGLKHRDISRILGMPLDTIRMWLFSGRRMLAVNDFFYDKGAML